MKFSETLTEAVEVHGVSLLAYTIVIAEAYAMLPVFDRTAVPAWEALMKADEGFARQIYGNLSVDYTEEDPYKNLNDLLYDVTVNKHLSVFKTKEGTHMGMSPEQNDVFRMVHDVLGHVGFNAAAFNAHLLKQDAGTPYKPLWGGSFTVRGEMNAYLKQAALYPTEARAALFTEVVGQICTYFVTGDYTQNKVALIDDVDYRHIGILSGEKAERMHQIVEQYNDPMYTQINTNVNHIALDKAHIHWKLLSPGTGAGNIT